MEAKDLRDVLEAFGREQGPLVPVGLLEGVRDLIVTIDDLELERAAVAAQVMREQAAAAQPGPTRVALAVQGDTVVAKTPEAEPAARTLRSILDMLASKKLGSMAQAALEVAARVELLELENRDLRSKLGMEAE